MAHKLPHNMKFLPVEERPRGVYWKGLRPAVVIESSDISKVGGQGVE